MRHPGTTVLVYIAFNITVQTTALSSQCYLKL